MLRVCVRVFVVKCVVLCMPRRRACRLGWGRCVHECEEEQVAEEAEWAALEVEGGDEVEEDEGVGEDAAPQ